MKKLISIITASLLFFGCAENKTINGVTHKKYGIFNQDDVKKDNVEYRIVWGNVFWSFVFSETIIIPVYLVGFAMYEPVGLKQKTPTNKEN